MYSTVSTPSKALEIQIPFFESGGGGLQPSEEKYYYHSTPLFQDITADENVFAVNYFSLERSESIK